MLTGRCAKEQALIAIPGIGQLTARGSPAPAPELGRVSYTAIASIAGLAPHLRDSGQFQGYRRMRPGRTGGRARAAVARKRHIIATAACNTRREALT
jgi:transposase